MRGIRSSVRFLAGLAGLVLISASQAQTPPIRIMPLGDSITYGQNTPGGYRLPLYVALTNAGYNVDFVGTRTDNATNALPDSNHQGMSGLTQSGWRISGGQIGLTEFMPDWFNAVADPDVILLHIGTYDFGMTNDYPNAINRLDALISRIATNRPCANIIVTTLLPRAEPYNTWITTTFNPLVSGKVDAQRALGRKVHFLDMYAYLTTGDLSDTLHPTAAGYAKMADAWFPAITNIIGTLGDTNAPAITRALGITNRQQVAVTFSKALDAAGATNLSNYAIDGGLTLSGATLSADKRTVTLTTGVQAKDTVYTVTVNNVTDLLTPTPLAIAPGSTANFKSVCRGYLSNVAESAAYNLVYTLDLPNSAGYGGNIVAYAADNHLLYGSAFSKVAYYVELQTPNGQLTYLWASMDAFTNDTERLGVPTVASGVVLQRNVSGVTIRSNDPNIATGTGLTGNLEFWPSNYDAVNNASVQNASGSLFDWGDHPTPGSYGCMQIHNFAASQTLFTFSNWGSTGGGTPDIGIGNCPNPKQSGLDWTFAVNAGMYSVKTLQVLVLRDNDTTPPTLVSAQAGFAGNLVTVTFSEPLAPDSVDGTRFSLDNGVDVLAATLLADQRTVNLATTPQPTGAALTLTVTGVRDSAAGNPVIPGSAIAVTAATALPPEISTNVGSLANGYRLVYTLDIPVKGNFIGTPNFYRVNQSTATGTFDRVAYYLELKLINGTVQYLWASMDAFTPYLSQVGVPTAASKAAFQQYVSNLDVLSNVAGITNGTGMTGGNLEFWPNDYGQSNALAVAGASNATFDFGDMRSAGGSHGSMQVHNSAAKQTLFGISNWGSDNQILGLGIGNQPSGSPDWTQCYNAGTAYTRRTLHVLVRPGPGSTNGLPAEVAANVPGAAGYQLVYSITNIPIPASFNTNAAAYYAVNNVTNVLAFSRVAYYLELQKSGDASPQFIWTSMDAFTADARKIGVPTNNCVFQQKVKNLDVLSNVGGIVNGTGIATGNIEFWPSDYTQPNSAAIPNASAASYDFGDGGGGTGTGYGSMQVHNHGAGAVQTLFALNHFNANSAPCLGIGNRPGTSDTDWTFADNAASYDLRRVLHVLVLPGGDSNTDTTRPTLALATGAQSLDRVTVYFSEALADNAAAAAFFTLNNGVTVTGATLAPNRQSVTLTTTPQAAGQTYTVSVTGVRDRSSAGNLILPGAAVTFTAPATARPNVLTNVTEAAGYALIHQLAISNVTSYAYGANYSVDESLLPTQTFDRVAYCLELTGTNGVAKWVYVSMDAFTADLSKIGVPTANRNSLFQQYVSNLNVYAYASDGNVAVTTGVGIAAGNIEFWPSNYGASNDKNIPGALGTVSGTNYYDFGDGSGPSGTTAGHGCMQIHNYLMAHTILSFSHMGSNNTNPGMGIGNNPTPSLTAGQYDTDYTFTYNGPAYSVKNLYVLARAGNTPANLLSGAQPSVFLITPASRKIHAGESATFYVQSAGATAFQWRRNGVWIPGANRSWLTLKTAATGDAGSYDALVYGSGTAYAVSPSATLTVTPLGTVLRLR